MRFQALALSLLTAFLATSCVTAYDTVAVHFSSEPPGAAVLVNGRPTGFSTPCMVALEKERQIITFEKQGFQVPARILYEDPFNDTWLMSEATVGPHTYNFATFINLDLFLQPVRTKNELIPGRVFVRLRPLADLEDQNELQAAAGPPSATDPR